MNFHSDEWVMERLQEHWDEALTLFDKTHIVGLFVQGSTNYGLDTENSDLDTKLIITPHLRELVFNKRPISTTHIRENNEHIDLKDIRLYMDTFRKGNLNFMEILFTPYFILNPMYEYQWNLLVKRREQIARMDKFAALKAMYGVATEKYHALEHRYPSKIDIIDKYGFDAKQLHHLFRINYFISQYIAGVPYEECLRPNETMCRNLKALKEQGCMDLKGARNWAKVWLTDSQRRVDEFLASYDREAGIDNEANELLDFVQYNIIKISLDNDLARPDDEFEL